MEDLQIGQAARVRTFPHVEGNYALHVYIPGNSLFHSSYLTSSFLYVN